MITSTCTVCGTPRREFPMVFRNDPQCSVVCKKAADGARDSEPVIAPSECSA